MPKRPPPPPAERQTRQRDAILEVLRAAERPLSPQEIVEHAKRTSQAVGIATVYRNLKRLVSDGTLQAVNLAGAPPRYEFAAIAHHHHFQCTACERVFDIPGCPGALSRLAPRGFSVAHHDLTLYGHCADCSRTPARSAR